MLNAVRAVDTAPALGVFYASQTGNGEELAEGLARTLLQAGYAAEPRSVSRLKPAQLRTLAYAVFVVSTHGDGDPPDDALDLFEWLGGPRPPQLQGLLFRVLALGDSSYLKFCETGRQLEKLLVDCGASPFANRIECDLDYAEPAGRFCAEVLAYCEKELQPAEHDPGQPGVRARPAQLSVVPNEAPWNRARPFPATVESVDRLTSCESGKDVRHITLSLAGSGLRYEPGDSLGVRAFNDPELVNELLQTLALDPGIAVGFEGRTRTLREWLTRHLEITRLTPDTVRGWAQRARGPGLSILLDRFDETGLKTFIESRQLVDLAEEYPADIDAVALLKLLRPLASRSYSIASSPEAAGDEVELTVVTHHSNATGRERSGLASEFLNRRLQPGDEVGVFLEANRRFRLPEDRSTPLILVAAGTGIAPFRAFFQQLEAEGVSPRSWLIFGNPRMRSDFLYQSEWLDWRRSGLLDRIDTAFSRDQAEKRYVQHVVRENAAEICNWLDWGARIYVCGALAMGHAVEVALLDGIASHRTLSGDEAAEELSRLRREDRLKKDLY